MFGGYLMKMVGTRPTYQIFSAVTLATGIIYYLFNRLYIVKKTQQDSVSNNAYYLIIVMRIKIIVYHCGKFTQFYFILLHFYLI